jgi:TonB family protein
MIAIFIRTAAVVLMLSQLMTPHVYAQNDPNPDTSSAATTQSRDTSAEGIRNDQIRRIGGGVTSPQVIHSVIPEYSEEARAEKFVGTVIVSLIVDTNGLPQSVHVVRGIGHGLDEKAVEAVTHYRFKPARVDGRSVPVRVNVEVNFQIKYNE